MSSILTGIGIAVGILIVMIPMSALIAWGNQTNKSIAQKQHEDLLVLWKERNKLYAQQNEVLGDIETAIVTRPQPGMRTVP